MRAVRGLSLCPGTMPSASVPLSRSSWLGQGSSSFLMNAACYLFLTLLLFPDATKGFYLLPLRSSTGSSITSKTCRQATAASNVPPLPRNFTDGAAPLPPTPSTFEVPSFLPPSESASAYEQAKQAPGPWRWPIVGNTPKLLRLGGADKFDRLMYDTYGPIVKTHILGVPWFVISDPLLAREVLVTRSGTDFKDRWVAKPLARLFGNYGIIFANAEEHQSNRRISMPAFHRPEILEHSAVVVQGLAKQLVARYASFLQDEGEREEGKEGGITVDLHDDMRFLTLEAVSQASFSLRLGLLEKDRGEGVVYHTKDVSFSGRRVDRLVRDNFRLLGQSIRFPLPGSHRVGLNKPFNALQKVNTELMGIEHAIIEGRRLERKQIRAEGGELPVSRDLLDVYLEAIENEDLSLSNESIFRNINDIFMAGSDTTATTISASLYEIVRRPQIKARVLAELANLDINDPAQMTPSVLSERLPYLDLCIKETLRLYPIAINLSRVAVKNTVLGGFKIPKGATVAPSIRNLHHDKNIWGPDAREYRPERWEGDRLEGGLPKGVPQGAYVPFGAGPRVCLGLRFALLEALTVCAILFKELDLHPVDVSRDLDVHYPAAMSFRGGVPVRVEGLN